MIMIIIYISQRAWRPSNRQIINYDAGIVLVITHQQRKNNFRQYKSATLNTGNLMSTKNRTRRTTTRNIRFPNQMIEQINIALEQKGSGISPSLGH